VSPERSEAASTDQRWGAVTTVSTIKRWHAPLLALVFWFGRHSEVAIGRLKAMQVIALARWTLVPNARAPRYLLFETSWSGAQATYIPDFGLLMAPQWRAIWGNTKGFPGSFPTTRLLAFIATVDWGCDHFWSDYDDGSTTRVVISALALAPRLAQFARDTQGLGADQFSARWETFRTEVQGLL
jgi:hypothetical protein